MPANSNTYGQADLAARRVAAGLAELGVARGEAVVINHVAEDPDYRNHHTPLQYGFQSYISMPIVLRDGTFFGTLCAIDMDGDERVGLARRLLDREVEYAGIAGHGRELDDRFGR